MQQKEFTNILIAIIIFTAIASFSQVLKENYSFIFIAFGFSTIIIAISVFSKKFIASLLDSDVEHEFFTMQRFWFKPKDYLKNPVPAGIIFPIFFSLFSLGLLKVPTLLTYETKASKYRASKRFGHYSYTEMTDLHISFIGAGGIIAVLALSIIAYFLPLPHVETLTKLAAYYAFVNMIPFSKLDGAQIFYGSRPLWTTLAIITFVIFLFALILPF